MYQFPVGSSLEQLSMLVNKSYPTQRWGEVEDFDGLALAWLVNDLVLVVGLPQRGGDARNPGSGAGYYAVRLDSAADLVSLVDPYLARGLLQGLRPARTPVHLVGHDKRGAVVEASEISWLDHLAVGLDATRIEWDTHTFTSHSHDDRERGFYGGKTRYGKRALAA